MGLLDSLFVGGSSGGGLLDFLRVNGMNQQMPSGIQSDQAQYGATPGATAQMWQAPPAITPQQPTIQPQSAPQQPLLQQQPVPQDTGMGIGDRLGSGFRGLMANAPAGPLGMLFGAGAGLAGLGQGNVEGQKANMTAAYLRSKGIPEVDIAAAVGNGRVPGNPEVLKTLLATNVKREEYRPATPEERKAAGMTGDNNTPMFINKETNEPKFGPPQTNVNVSTEKTGQAELAKTGVESYVAAQNAGRDAQKRVALYDTMEKAAQSFTPGATAEARLTAKRYLKDAGLIKGEDVPDGEVMQMISRQLGIHAQPKGQGAVSNYERELFAKSLPNMTQSPEGLKMAIDISRKLEQFDQRVAEIYRESAKANKGMPNYLEVQEKIAGLGSPLSDGQMAAISGSGAPPATPASSTGWTNIGNGVKIRPK